MRLTSWEEERLLIFSAAELARRHRAAGLRLNAPEAIALMCDAMLEAARAGAPYGEVEAAGYAAVKPDEVIDGVRELVDDVRVEVLLEDGARLVVLLDPLGRGRPAGVDGPGAIVPTTDDEARPAGPHGPDAVTPAEIQDPGTSLSGSRDAVDPGAGASSPERLSLEVRSTSIRVIRISSHFPFERVNPRLEFDRSAAAGFRLDLPAGSSERWSPGETKAVILVRYARDGHDGEQA
jgi:urease subunit gamma/beta